MTKLLEGKVAIVTGAGRGIGVEIARELASSGANMVLNYATSVGPAEKLAKELSENGGKHIAVKANVSVFNEPRSWRKQLTKPSARLTSWSITPVSPATRLSKT